MPTSQAEAAVRAYLRYLNEPDSLIDRGALAKLEKAVNAAKDPIERLHAVAALRRASSADPSEVEDAFVEAAPAYAAEADLDRADFAALGVPDAILQRAFGGGRRGGRRSTRGAGRARRSTGGARGGVDAVKRAVLAMAGEFKLAELTVASPITVRKAVDELIEAGQVERLGPDPHHASRGRAPIVYRTVR